MGDYLLHLGQLAVIGAAVSLILSAPTLILRRVKNRGNYENQANHS